MLESVKKWLKWLIVCAVLLVGAGIYVLATLAQYDDPNIVLSDEDSERILKMFEDEIDVVEDHYEIQIDDIDKTNLEYIKQIAVPNLGSKEYEFRDLMTCLGNACAKYAPWWERSVNQCPVCSN